MLERHPRNTLIVMDHLGLDMSQAWEHIHTLLFDQNSKPTNVKYRLLILSHNSLNKSTWPKEVVDWSEYVPRSLAKIQDDMKETVEIFNNERRTLDFSVRLYDEVPVVHGWHLKQPIQLWHVAHCRWRRKTFDWGGEKYVRIDEQSHDPVARDIANIFDSYFEHLWATSTAVTDLQITVN
jgi:hypothetical protein